MSRKWQDQPAYLRIANDLRAQIENGVLNPGDILPSLSELSAQYGVSVTAARHAIMRLAEKGLARTKQGVGAFVAEPKAPPRPGQDSVSLTDFHLYLNHSDIYISHARCPWVAPAAYDVAGVIIQAHEHRCGE